MRRTRGPETFSGEYDPSAEYLGPASVSELNFYPVKSLGGISVESMMLGPRGPMNDRNWMVVDPDGKFLTQREMPRMALIKPSLGKETLVLSAPGMDDLRIPTDRYGDVTSVDIWKSEGLQAVDHGVAVNLWLSYFLKRECRLVRMANDEVRQVDLRYAGEGDQVGFADGFPELLISEGSLADLNSRMNESLPMNRFRPNIVVKGVEPYAEDAWEKIMIGETEFDVVKPCARCPITTIDQETAERGKEPLKTLATYRRARDLGYPELKGVLFGQNLIHRSQGEIRVGDSLEIVETK